MSIGHQALVMYPVGEGPTLRIAPRIGRPPPPVTPEILSLAAELDTDPADSAAQLPLILKAGERTFGEKRLELYLNGGEVHARVWIGRECIYSMPIQG